MVRALKKKKNVYRRETRKFQRLELLALVFLLAQVLTTCRVAREWSNIHSVSSRSSSLILSPRVSKNATKSRQKISVHQYLEAIYPLEAQDPYLREHLEYFCRDTPCQRQLPDFVWPPVRFPNAEQMSLFQKWAPAQRFVDECHSATPAHLLRTELVVIPNGTSRPDTWCGWQTGHEQFQKTVQLINTEMDPVMSAYQQTFDRVMPLKVPDSNAFQHFTDGVLPKLMMHLDVILKDKVKILMAHPRDYNIHSMMQRMGLAPLMQTQPIEKGLVAITNELYSGCIVPPVHPLLFRRARVRLTQRAPTHRPKGPIVLIQRTVENSFNGGRFIINYEELKFSLIQEFGADRIVEYNSRSHGLNSTMELFSSASAVVASHGGALANLIFAPIGTVVIEAMPCKESGLVALGDSGLIYYIFAAMLGHRFWRIQATSNDKHVVIDREAFLIQDVADDRNVIMDPATVIRILKDPDGTNGDHALLAMRPIK